MIVSFIATWLRAPDLTCRSFVLKVLLLLVRGGGTHLRPTEQIGDLALPLISSPRYLGFAFPPTQSHALSEIAWIANLSSSWLSEHLGDSCTKLARSIRQRDMFHTLLFATCLLALGAANSTTQEPPQTTSHSGVGCQAMCCEGKNNDCHSRGLRLNGRGSPTSLCFCDEGCPAMGDCCFDYDQACTVVDCEMSDWTEYSDCSSSCGIGTKSRSRTVLVEPRFGGTTCPPNLRETTICTGTSCNETEVELEQDIEKETAKIMPASFARFRSMKAYNADMDIRKNLYYQYYYKNKHTYSGYCSSFRVVSARKACQSYIAPWANVLKTGATICVACQKTAMENERSNGLCTGHGEVGVSTNWNAVNAPGCTGWWERMEDNQECTCKPEADSKEHSFIFL
ncbi:somatomedin-B and thrombospondin type-1 domain-containing protein-like [Watersipora subatra]|uniref:somatomedin-B and thrombospondin type-1 domain-containing protein-like n=1 Tax=Watersipora subatra TaxID=2589382 RepID=UPI00355AFD97